VLAGVAIVGHVLLLFAARRVNLLFLLAGVYIAMSVLSVASALSAYSVAKYARVYTTVLMVMVGVGYFRIHSLGRATRIFSVFVIFSLFSPLWSAMPFPGMTYKAFFVFSFFAGVMMAYSVRDWREGETGMRYLVVLATLGTLYAAIFLAPDEQTLARSRLNVLDINPVRLGITAASLSLLCCYVGLYDRLRLWRGIGAVAMFLLLAAIALTGSRSGLLVALAGTLLAALPLLQQPRRLLPAAIVVVLLAAGVFLMLRDTFGMQRMFSLTNTRASQWQSNLDMISHAPLFGHGWIYAGRDSGYANLHSMYYQILAEMGIVGAVLFAGCLMPVLLQWYHCYRSVGRVARGSEFVILPAMLIGASLVMGIFETSALAGTLPDTLLLGFAIGMTDRLPALLQRERLKAKSRIRYGWRPAAGNG
jgi:O-antigen ligase